MFKLNFHSIKMWWTRKREAFTVFFTAELMVSGNGGCWDSALPCAGTSHQIPCMSLRGVNQTKPSLFCCLCSLSALFCACARHRGLGGLCLPWGIWAVRPGRVPAATALLQSRSRYFLSCLGYANISSRNHQRE